MAYHLEIWDNVQCASGATRKAVITSVLSGAQRISLAADEVLDILAARFDQDGTELVWIQHAVARNVVRVEDDVTGEVWEWRISRTQEMKGEDGTAVIRVKADPILLDLRSAFILEEIISGGLTYRNLGGIGITAAQYIDTFILAHPQCPTWLALGTIDPEDAISLAWDSYSPLELLRDIEKQFPGINLRCRRNGSTNYLIDLTDVGAGVTGPPVEFGRNIINLTRSVGIDAFATVIIPRGRMPAGGIEMADIGDNAWEITAKSGTDLTLADPLGGAGPIAYDDQLNSLYLESASTTSRVQISDSVASTQIVTVSDATAFAVADTVRVVKDSAGTLLTELPKPSSVTTWGRVVGLYDMPDQPGSRNYCPVGSVSSELGFDDYDGMDTYNLGCLVDGAHAGVTTLNLKGLPSGLVVAPGDRVYIYAATDRIYLLGGPTYYWTTYVAAGGGDTVGGDGLAQLTVNDAVTASDTYGCVLHTGLDVSSSVPDWPGGLLSLNTETGLSTKHDTLLAIPVSSDEGWTGTKDIVGTLDGDHTAGSGVYYFDITGLDASTYYPVGAYLHYNDDTVTERSTRINHGFKTDGSGGARLYTQVGQNYSSSDGNAAWLVYPTNPFDYGAPMGNYALYAGTGEHDGFLSFDTATSAIRYVPGRSTVNVAVGLTIDGPAQTWEQTTTDYRMPKFDIKYRTLGSAGAYSTSTIYADDTGITTSANTPLNIDFSGSLVISEDKEVYVDFYGPRAENVGLGQDTYSRPPHRDQLWCLRYITIWLGDDPEPPVVPGSKANILWQRANERLAEVGDPNVQYQIALHDLARIAGFDPTAEALTLGADVPVRDEKLGIDIDARIVGISYDLRNRGNSVITLENVSRLATAGVLNPRFTVRRGEAVFNPDTGASEQVAAVEGTEVRPAVTETGAPRASAPPRPVGGVVPVSPVV